MESKTIMVAIKGMCFFIKMALKFLNNSASWSLEDTRAVECSNLYLVEGHSKV